MLNAFFLKKFGICAIAINNDRIRKHHSQLFTAGAVSLDHFDFDTDIQ